MNRTRYGSLEIFTSWPFIFILWGQVTSFFGFLTDIWMGHLSSDKIIIGAFNKQCNARRNMYNVLGGTGLTQW